VKAGADTRRNRFSAEEFIFVFISVRTPGLVRRLSLASTALLAFACAASGANAQTAPQLLPYTAKLIAGGGPSATYKAGATCPVSGLTMSDAYGGGCLATELQLASPRYAVADKDGNIFFSDYTSSLIRRIDATTGVVTTVAGGPTTSPAAGATCGANVSADAKGDGCLATLVNLYEPTSLAFAADGDLYFVETGNADVRRIAATGGSITTTGVIALVVGNPALKTAGYAVNQGSTTITPGSSSSLLDFPAAISFDAAGNLYIADEGNEALEVVNLTSATETIQGVSVPANTIAKIAGYGAYQSKSTTGECPNGIYVSSTKRGGCYFGVYSASASPAVTALLDAPYAIALDPSGNVYFDNEFIQGVGKIAAGSLTNYAGINNSYGTRLVRAQAGTFAIGSNFGLAVDSNANAYISDALNGVIWRVDGAGQSMYVVAGGASTTCSIATDKYGDSCPATQATFGKSGTSYSSSGVYGVSVDAYSDLFVGDSITNIVREVASGTQFGPVAGAQVTNNLDIHFATGDSPAASAYTLTTGAANFSLGSAACTSNSDGTTDCILPVTATPSVLGAFTGTLQVKSTLGGTATFPLSGTFVQNPVTRLAVTAVPGGACNSNTITTTTPVAMSATLTTNGPSAPGGTITFLANGTPIGTPQSVTNTGTTSAPVYGASLSYTFNTAGTYTITASYSGDSYYKSSTGTAATVINSTTPSFSTSVLSNQQSSIAAGQTALYSFNVAQSVYTGTISFACSGLPVYASCNFSPASITATGCSQISTVALSILTQQPVKASPAGIGFSGRGGWQALGIVAGFGMALLIGIRRRRLPTRFGQIAMAIALLLAASGIVACGGNSTVATPGTPSGSSTITVTATGSAGTVATFTVPLTIQ
jgi:large repetitive protein